MSTQVLAVVCAWCNRIMTSAPAGSPVSHTICPSCLDWTFSPERKSSLEPGHEAGHFTLPDRIHGDGDDR
jgi:hypothetical protein